MSFENVSPREAAFTLGSPDEALDQRLKNLEAQGIVTISGTPSDRGVYMATLQWWQRCDPQGKSAWVVAHRYPSLPRKIYEHLKTYADVKLSQIAGKVYKDALGRVKPQAQQEELRYNEAWHGAKDSIGCPTGTYREQLFGFSAPAAAYRTILSSRALSLLRPAAPPPPPPTRPGTREPKPEPSGVVTFKPLPGLTAKPSKPPVCPEGQELVGGKCVPISKPPAPPTGTSVSCPDGTVPTSYGTCEPPTEEPTDIEAEIEMEANGIEQAGILPFQLPWWGWGLVIAGGAGLAYYLWKGREAKTANPFGRNPSLIPGGGGVFRYDKKGHQDYDVYFQPGPEIVSDEVYIGRVWNFAGAGKKPVWRTNLGFAKTRMDAALDLLADADLRGKVKVGRMGTWLHMPRPNPDDDERDRTKIDVDPDIGLKLMNWHSSMGDPVYATGSMAFGGHPVERWVAQGAVDNIAADHRTAKMSPGIYGWGPEEVAELEEILDYFMMEHGIEG